MILSRISAFFSRIKGFFDKARERVRKFDRNMRERYHPARLALATVGVMLVLISVMLFLPPYLGLSNDGSYDALLGQMGLQRISAEDEDVYFNYYDRTYRIIADRGAAGNTSAVLKTLVGMAMKLDTLITRDDIFDMRFLAAIYTVMYLFAVYPLIRAALSRVKLYSEGILVAAVSVMVLADVSVATRFASLYTAPLEWILILAITDMLLLTAEHEGAGPYPYMLVLFASLLMYVNQYCAIAGIIFSTVYWLLVRQKASFARRAMLVMCALVLCMQSTVAVMKLSESQTVEQKYDQMTRGVLFQAENPEEALAVFGIEPRYSILTETYSNQDFPAVLPESGALDDGFLDKYSTPDIAAYYAANPGALLGLFNIAVHDSFITRPDYSGNYERDYGMEPRAKSLFMSAWSMFKSQSAPKTAAFAVLLVAALVVLLKPRKDKGEQDMAVKMSLRRMTVVIVALFAACEVITVVIMSGDSMLMRESFMIGGCIDIVAILFISEILRRLKILGEE